MLHRNNLQNKTKCNCALPARAITQQFRYAFLAYDRFAHYHHQTNNSFRRYSILITFRGCRRFLSNLAVPDDLAAIAVYRFTGLPGARTRSAVEINLQRIKRARPTKQSDAARAGRKLHFLTSGAQINGLVYHRPDLSTAISTSTRVATQCKRFVRLSAPALRELPASSWLSPPRCCAERVSLCVLFVERKSFVNYTGCPMRSIEKFCSLKNIRRIRFFFFGEKL